VWRTERRTDAGRRTTSSGKNRVPNRFSIAKYSNSYTLNGVFFSLSAKNQARLDKMPQLPLWVKVKVRTLDIAPLRETPPQNRSRIRHLFSRDLSLPAHPHVHPHSECATPVFAFPAIAGTHLPTPERWKAELARVAGYVVRQLTCPKTVTHPTTNRAQCRAAALIQTNAIPLH